MEVFELSLDGFLYKSLWWIFNINRTNEYMMTDSNHNKQPNALSRNLSAVYNRYLKNSADETTKAEPLSVAPDQHTKAVPAEVRQADTVVATDPKADTKTETVKKPPARRLKMIAMSLVGVLVFTTVILLVLKMTGIFPDLTQPVVATADTPAVVATPTSAPNPAPKTETDTVAAAEVSTEVVATSDGLANQVSAPIDAASIKATQVDIEPVVATLPATPATKNADSDGISIEDFREESETTLYRDVAE